MSDPTPHHSSQSAPPIADAGDLAHLLEPALIDACRGRLSSIQWFRSAWQAGGASTGYAKYDANGSGILDVVVKLPVGPAEYRWTASLGGGVSEGPQDAHAKPLCACTPRVLASGTSVGGHDLAWLVVERLDGSPLNQVLNEQAVKDLLAAAVEWYAASRALREVAEATATKDWTSLIAKGRDIIHKHGIDEEQRWNEAIKHTQKALPRLLERWSARPINTWCHGDLHPGNALRRKNPSVSGETGGCVLIDLALVHPGHWVEDAVYLERLFWAKPEMLCGVKPVSYVGKLLRERGMAGGVGGEDYTTLANIRRILMAASVPAFLLHEGHPRYVHAALQVLEKTLPMVGR